MRRGTVGRVAAFLLVAAAALSVRAEEIPAGLLDEHPGGRVERARILVTGSESMTPFTFAIAKRLAARWTIPEPEIQPVGTQAGFARFCAGIGGEYPDIVAATRRIRQSEFDRCLENRIADIIEVPIGFSAVAFVGRRVDAPVALTPRIIYQAVAAEVPQGQDLVVNPYQRWREIDKSLPADEIRLLLPSASTGTHNFFDDVFLQGGCRKFSVIRLTFDARDRVRLCIKPRSDGRVVDLGVAYDEILPQTLAESPAGTIGILPYFVALAHQDRLRILPVNGILPSAETIINDSYEGVHTLYYYVKRAHMRDHEGNGVVRGLRQFIVEATGEEARGTDGYLDDGGLIPLPAAQRLQQRRAALRLERFSR
ncbi:MAG: substrate-binding domain-containing protein [Rhodospirillaceae bacterium]